MRERRGREAERSRALNSQGEHLPPQSTACVRRGAAAPHSGAASAKRRRGGRGLRTQARAVHLPLGPSGPPAGGGQPRGLSPHAVRAVSERLVFLLPKYLRRRHPGHPAFQPHRVPVRHPRVLQLLEEHGGLVRFLSCKDTRRITYSRDGRKRYHRRTEVLSAIPLNLADVVVPFRWQDACPLSK